MNLPLITPSVSLTLRRTGTAGRGEDTTRLRADELHDEYAQSVFDYVFRRIEERAEAEDVTIEVFTEALRVWPRFRGASSPKTFLLAIARHRCADALRRQQRNRRRVISPLPAAGNWLLAIPSSDAGPPELLQQQEASAHIRQLVFALPELQREAILMQYADGLSVAEIADVLKKSPAAVNSLLQRARTALYRNGREYFAPEENA